MTTTLPTDPLSRLAFYRKAYRRLLHIQCDQATLLSECDFVLTLVPARSNPDLANGKYLECLQSDYIAPLMKKLRQT